MIEEKKVPPQTVINAGTIIGSTYAQLVNVSVTDIDVTLEFAFINPRDPSTGQVVARVTLPKAVGLDLANTISMTSTIHDKKKGGKQDG